MDSGIYKITNSINNKQYIGSAKHIKKRWNNHLGGLRHNIHNNTKLQNSWNKYGESAFVFSVIEYCAINKLIEREQHYIDSLKPWYNINPKAESRLGAKLTQKQKDEMSKTRKGKPSPHKGKKFGPLSKAHRDKVVAAGRKALIAYNKSRKGKKLSQLTKQKISKKMKNRKMSEEHRSNLSIALKKYHEKCASGACPI